jgi:hypothetical protein
VNHHVTSAVLVIWPLPSEVACHHSCQCWLRPGARACRWFRGG